MKKIVLLLMVMLSVNLAYGQSRHHSQGQGHRNGIHREYNRDGHHRQGHVHEGSRSIRNGRAVDRGSHRHHRSHGAAARRQVRCVGDWQTLWNGCHVRIKADRYHIYLASGDRLLSGEEIILLPNGLYLVRLGSFWHVHDTAGDRIFNIWGDTVELMSNGIFRCYRSGRYYYYDQFGNIRE